MKNTTILSFSISILTSWNPTGFRLFVRPAKINENCFKN